MSFRSLTDIWCDLDKNAEIVILTDEARFGLASAICKELQPFRCSVVNVERDSSYEQSLADLRAEDLAVVLLSVDSFVYKGFNQVFSPFNKPSGLQAKYAFVRLDIPAEALRQGLSTPKAAVIRTIERLHSIPPLSSLRVTNPAGTDITMQITQFQTGSHWIAEAGGVAFLPPSEIYAGILPGSACGQIVVDVTIGQLMAEGRCLGAFGLVDKPTVLVVRDSKIQDIRGGKMAAQLKEILWGLAESCRVLVELGHGLSAMAPTGIIGVDECIIETCHFGIGDGTGYGIANSAPIHLDVVVGNPSIELKEG